ncbi:MAG: rod shape-determining protein MreD [Bacillota bacterium]|nr:rod shape-determining protein MreD [Bacillota bacterium]MDW7677364.1 rod shape-determining protein MreD [Bacillota bacterium]
MQKIVIALSFFISIVLESAFFPFISMNGVVPNLTMILVICYALHQEEDKAAVTGLLAGLVKDTAVGRIIGVSAITFMMLGYLTSHYKHKIFAEHATTPLIITLMGTLFHETFYLLFVFFLGYQINLIYTQQVWILQALYNLLMVMPVYLALRKLLNWHVMKKQY